MTNEEAIKELKEDKALYESEICYAGDGTPDGDLIFALDMAIQALEKQVPKKPYIWNNEKPICPYCHRTEYIKNEPLNTHCGFCGQSIDFSEVTNELDR